MNPLLAELRALRARTGLRQQAIAERMGMDPKAVSEIFTGTRKIPRDFEADFRSAVAELAEEGAVQELAEAKARARALREAAGITDQTAEAVAA